MKEEIKVKTKAQKDQEVRFLFLLVTVTEFCSHMYFNISSYVIAAFILNEDMHLSTVQLFTCEQHLPVCSVFLLLKEYVTQNSFFCGIQTLKSVCAPLSQAVKA